MQQPARLECLRCGHTWISRIIQRPVRCPVCQSSKWDKPRPNSQAQQVRANDKPAK